MQSKAPACHRDRGTAAALSSEIIQPSDIIIGNIPMPYAFFFFFTADEMTFGKKNKKKNKDSYESRWLETYNKDEKTDRPVGKERKERMKGEKKTPQRRPGWVGRAQREGSLSYLASQAP